MTLLAPLAVAPRISAIRAQMHRDGLAALVVGGSSNVRWCSGFTGSNALVVITADDARFLTDRRYEEQAPVELAAVGADMDLTITRNLISLAAAALPDGAVGLDPVVTSWADARRWHDALSAEPHPSSIVAELRAVKDDAEVARIGAAAAVVDAVLLDAEALLRPGVTEREMAQALDGGIRAHGSEPAYETIVASGPNGALPHARPTDREFVAGDLVVIDVGAVVDGYRSDMTRTFAIETAPPEAHVIHAVVTEAQAAGVAAVAPGVATGEIDATCRSLIGQHGYGEQFAHGTGHGVGLDIHEAPSVSTMNAAILQPGHVITVEPGIYLPGMGGVRIEDTVLVTDDGCRPLTSAPKRPL